MMVGLTVESPLDHGLLEARLRRGTTNRDEVRAWLGAPAGVTFGVDTSGERYTEWIYRQLGNGRSPSALQALRIRFDVLGTVCAYSWSDQADAI